MANDGNRYAQLKARGAQDRARMIARAPDNPLDAIAYLHGALGADEPETVAAIERARSAEPPFTWTQCAAALGDTGERAGRQLEERLRYRRRPKNR